MKSWKGRMTETSMPIGNTCSAGSGRFEDKSLMEEVKAINKHRFQVLFSRGAPVQSSFTKIELGENVTET